MDQVGFVSIQLLMRSIYFDIPSYSLNSSSLAVYPRNWLDPKEIDTVLESPQMIRGPKMPFTLPKTLFVFIKKQDEISYKKIMRLSWMSY